MAETPLEQHDGELPKVRTIGNIFLIDLTGRCDDDYPDHQRQNLTLAKVLSSRGGPRQLYPPVLMCLVEVFGLLILSHLMTEQ